MADRREQQARQPHVDAEAAPCRRSWRHVEPRRGACRSASTALARLELDGAGRRRRRRASPARRSGALDADRMADHAVARPRARRPAASRRSDAAPSSCARAVAAARRSTPQASATLDEPPVTLMPSSRAILATTHWPPRTVARLAPRSAARMHRQARRRTSRRCRRSRSWPAGIRRTRASGTSSSSATSIASAVCTPWPISLLVHRQQHAAVGGDLDPAVEADLAVDDRQVSTPPRRGCAAAARPSRPPARRRRPGRVEQEARGASRPAASLGAGGRGAAAARADGRAHRAGRCRSGRCW